MATDPRSLPAVHRVLADPVAQSLADRVGHDVAAAAVRRALGRRRSALAAGLDPGACDVPAIAAEAAASEPGGGLVRVLNATGVLVHTNLGRAPLAPEAVAAVAATAGGYTNLELDLATGRRGSRQDLVEGLVREVTGAEAALVVNNCAAALVLVLAALARGREVVVSRGQLIEIGDGFRLPEIMAQAGARLVEVGATNRTRIADYEAAIGPDTALLLRAHPSNFRVVGFVEEVAIDELARLGAARDVPVLDDLGSGLLVADPALPGEPGATASLAAGADLVCFSADKLLGGPQAGIIAGRSELVAGIRRHPLARALRIDRLSLAALEATLRLHRDPAHARRTVPVLRMAHEPAEAVAARARLLADALGGEVVATAGRVGGGALPTIDLESHGCALPDDPEPLHARLRTGAPPLVARVVDGRLVLDARTLDDAEAEQAIAAVRRARGGAPPDASC